MTGFVTGFCLFILGCVVALVLVAQSGSFNDDDE